MHVNLLFHFQLKFVVCFHKDREIAEVSSDDILDIETVDVLKNPVVTVLWNELQYSATILQAIPENGLDSRDLIAKLRELVREKNASIRTLASHCPVEQPKKRARMPPLCVSLHVS